MNFGVLNSYLFPVATLCKSAKNGDLENVKKLASKKNVNTLGFLGWAPLHKACEHGHLAIVQYLLSDELAADVNIRDAEQHTPLHFSAANGHIDIVELLLQRGCRVNEKDNCGETSLHMAVANNQIAVVKLLLQHGAQVNMVNNLEQWTPLHIAMSQGHMEIAKLLIQAGGVCDVQDVNGNTPIDFVKNDAVLESLGIPPEIIQSRRNKSKAGNNAETSPSQHNQPPQITETHAESKDATSNGNTAESSNEADMDTLQKQIDDALQLND